MKMCSRKRALYKYIENCEDQTQLRRLYDPDRKPFNMFLRSIDEQYCRFYFIHRSNTSGTDKEAEIITGTAGAEIFRSAPRSRLGCIAVAYALRLTLEQTNRLLNICGFKRLRKDCIDDAVCMQLLRERRAEDNAPEGSFRDAFLLLRSEYELDKETAVIRRSAVARAGKVLAGMKQRGMGEMEYLPERGQLIYSLAGKGADIRCMNSILRLAAQEPLNPYSEKEAQLLFELGHPFTQMHAGEEAAKGAEQCGRRDVKVFGACVPGRRHIEQRFHCQDSEITAAVEGGVLAVLSDGAGSSQHSQLAAEANTQSAAMFFRTHDIDEWLAQSEEQMAEDIGFVTRQACLQQADAFGTRPQLMSATLVGAIVSRRTGKTAVFHTGDGEVWAQYADGTLRQVSAPENLGRSTFFTVSEESAKHTRITKLDTDELAALLLVTDGVIENTGTCRENFMRTVLEKAVDGELCDNISLEQCIEKGQQDDHTAAVFVFQRSEMCSTDHKETMQ